LLISSCLFTVLQTLHFFSTTAPPTDIYTLSLHDALPIFPISWLPVCRSSISVAYTACQSKPIERFICAVQAHIVPFGRCILVTQDRKSSLNSSHVKISYAVFCLKKKKVSSPST